jgi:hypothetical protein
MPILRRTLPRAPWCAGLVLITLACGCPDRFSPHTGETAPPDSRPDTDETALPPSGAPVALVADGANQRYVWIRLDTQELLYELDLRELFPQHCHDAIECVAFGSEHSVDPVTGEDLALIIAYITAVGQTPEEPGLAARLRLASEGPSVDWQLTQLDWTVHFSDRPDICGQTTACEAPSPVGSDAWQDCTFRNAHAVKVVDETETHVTMWIADTGQPSRAIQVELDKSSSCGVVTEVHGDLTTDGWTDESGPNDLDLVDYDGVSAMLLNHLGTAGNDALGVSTFWTRDGDGWALVYRHPVDGGHIMGGHNSDMVIASDGQRYHVYAHGNGAGAGEVIQAWDPVLDHRGTVAILRVVDGQPVYLLDATAPDPGFGFLRDADMLADDSFLVTDSGCMNHTFVGCEKEAAIWHVAIGFTGLDGSDQSGAFTEDHDQQRFSEATPIDDPWPSRVTCGLSTPYEADLIYESQLGTALTAALETPLAGCGD